MARITLLDGGMGQELIRRSENAPNPLWSANVMRKEPHLVADIYRDFIDAGSTAITLNSYSVTRPRLARLGNEAWFEELQTKALEIALHAAGPNGVDIVGCLPPLVGSYAPESTLPFDECLEQYHEIASIQAPHVTALLAETMCCITEAVAATQAMKQTGKPAWCALTVKDGFGTNLRSGETVTDAVKAVSEAGADAILINCSWPESVSQGLPYLKQGNAAFGAYANGFSSIEALKLGGTVEALEARTDLSPEAYGDFAQHWADQGATIIGGCCEVGPAHISATKAALTRAGHEIVGITL